MHSVLLSFFISFYTGYKEVIVRGFMVRLLVDISTCAGVGKVQTKASHQNIRAESRVCWSGMRKHAVMSKLPLIRT